MTWEPKMNLQMGGNNPRRAIWFPGTFYGFTWAKTTPSVPKFVDLSPIGCATLETQNSQRWKCRNNIKTPRRDPNHCTLTKPLPSPGKNEEHCKTMNGECTRAPKTWGREKRGCMVEWAYVFGFLLAQGVKMRFSKMGSLPYSNFFPYSSHSMQ